jgi:hypothetical protein
MAANIMTIDYCEWKHNPRRQQRNTSQENTPEEACRFRIHTFLAIIARQINPPMINGVKNANKAIIADNFSESLRLELDIGF